LLIQPKADEPLAQKIIGDSKILKMREKWNEYLQIKKPEMIKITSDFKF